MKRILIGLGGLITLIIGGATLAASGPTGHPLAGVAPRLASRALRAAVTTPSLANRQSDTRTSVALQMPSPTAPATSATHAHTPLRHATSAIRVSTPSATKPARTVLIAAPVRPMALSAAASTHYLLLDPATAAPGATLSVRGGGFAPGAALHLVVAAPGQSSVASGAVTADPNGRFDSPLVVPADEAAPTVQIAAQDAQGQATTATLLLRSAPPQAGVSPNVVTPGQHVSFWIAGFRPGETVRLYAGRLPAAAGASGQERPLLVAMAGSDGRGSWPLAIPYGAGGTNQLVAIGDRGQAPAVAPYLLLNLYPHAAVSSFAPQPGQSITFFGGGFGPGEAVTLHLDRWDGPVLARTHADGHGGLRRLGPYRVPFGLSAGPHLYLLRGTQSHAMTTVGLTIEPFFASVSPSTYAAGPGTTLSFYGQGFAPHEIVRVYLDRTSRTPGTEVSALRTTAAGTLILRSGSYMLPATVHGPQIHFTLVGDISGAEATTSVQYLAPPGPTGLIGKPAPYTPPARQHAPNGVVPSQPSGPVLIATPPRVVSGGRVALWGTGFLPRTTLHFVATSPANPQGWALGTARSDRTGTVQTALTLPPWVAQATAVRAYGGSRAGAPSAQAELVVEPPTAQVTPATYSGQAGALYRLSGSGFTAGERVALYLDSLATPPLAVTSSGDGHLTFNDVPVPAAAAGAHTFIVRGAHGEVASAPFTLDGWTPYLLLSTYSSQPERPVTVRGQGFAPGEIVHLFLTSAGGAAGSDAAGGGSVSAATALGSDDRLVGAAIADTRGAFQATNAFTIPTRARGSLTVVAVGATTGQAVRATLNVQPFGPSLWLSGYAGHPGSTVAFTGTGFARDDVLDVFVGDAGTPATTFRAHGGAFGDAGALHLPYSTPGGMLRLTVRGRLSEAKVTLRYLVVPYTPGAGFEVRRRHGVTTLRLGAGGFAPGEMVEIYVGADADISHPPLRLVRADKAGNLPLWPVLQVRGTPRVRLAYTLIGRDSGTKASAVYVPPRPGKREP